MEGLFQFGAVFAVESPKLMVGQPQDPRRLFLVKPRFCEGPLEEPDLEFPYRLMQRFSHQVVKRVSLLVRGLI